METAKVDIRKLQLLNDRINQCIDALNQVRLSVHGLAAAPGLSHSAGLPGLTGNPGFGIGYGGYVQGPLGPTAGFGLSHTGALGNPLGTAGAVNPWINPGLATGNYGQPAIYGQSPMVPSPYFSQFGTGLSHSGTPGQLGIFSPGINPFGPAAFGSEATADPLLTARIAQTFPYAQFPVPPVVTIY